MNRLTPTVADCTDKVDVGDELAPTSHLTADSHGAKIQS